MGCSPARDLHERGAGNHANEHRRSHGVDQRVSHGWISRPRIVRAANALNPAWKKWYCVLDKIFQKDLNFPTIRHSAFAVV
jgi:hypothetical protein